MDRDQIPLTIYFTKFYLTAGNRSYLCLVLKSTQFWPQMSQIKFIFLMIFYEDNGQNLWKSCCNFIQTKKNLVVNLMMKNILASALFYNNLENFAMKSQQNLSVFCKTDKQCVCAFNTNRKKIREISKPLSSKNYRLNLTFFLIRYRFLCSKNQLWKAVSG